MISVAFLGAKRIGLRCLHFLLSERSALGIDVNAVLTNARGTELVDLARAGGVAIYPELEDLPRSATFDFLISVQYHRILKAEHLAKARKCINLHMAPLPEYRGCNQFSFAIANGDTEFGTTLHIMDERIDHGPVLAQRRFAIPPRCFVNELYELTEDESLSLFKENIPAILRNRLPAIPQAELVRERPTRLYFRRDIERLKEIKLDWPAEKIDRHIRATLMPGFEPPFLRLGDRKVFLTLSPKS